MGELILHTRDFSFTYDDDTHPALRGISVKIRAGEALAVLGPLGSGTSTLCRAAAGLLSDRGRCSGELRIASGMAAMLGDDPEAQLTGMGTTVWDEVLLPARLNGIALKDARPRAHRVLEKLGLTALSHRRVEELSGGQRQLTALASLMCMGRKLLILDQPGLSLDSAARQRLRVALEEHCAAGGAVLIAGHQHDELSDLCSRTVFLEQGSPLEQDDDDAPSVMDFDAHGVWNALGSPQDRAAQSYAAQSHPAQPLPAQSRPAQPRPAAPTDVSSHALIRAENLSVQRGRSPVLSHVSFALHAGQIAAVLGPNGSGKSSLLMALAGLLPRKASKVSGRIYGPGGVELTRAAAHRRAEHLAWVGQDPSDQLSAISVAAELRQAAPRRFPADTALERTVLERTVLERLGLSAYTEVHPYDLSLAQRKDLVIATALLLQPSVLLLDEPTLGRDAPAMTRLTRMLRDFTAEGGAVVVTTHDLRWAEAISDQLLHVPGQ